MKNIQKKFALLLALVLLTSLLGACGDGAASSAASTAETPAVSEEAAAPATEAPQPEIETGSAETVSAQEPTDEVPAVPGAHKSIAGAAPDIPMELKCYVEAQGHDDMDLFAHMVFLDENDQILYTEGEHNFGYTGPDNRLRVSLRALDEERSLPHFPEQSFKVMEKLKPGQIVPIDIQIWPTGVKFKAGQKLRLVIAGYDYMGHPLPGGEGTRFRPDNKGVHVIHTGGQYDSFLSIPTI